MSPELTLSGGALHNGGTFYLLVAEGSADEDTSRLARGRREGDVIRLEMLTGIEEFVSIDTLPDTWSGLGEVVCMTAEGAITFAWSEGTTNEVVIGSGYSRSDSRGIGRMTTVRECNDSLFAMGFGGQVYRRTVHRDWESIGPGAAGGRPPSYYAVAEGRKDLELVFGGVRISEYAETDEIRAAEISGNASLLADLILDSVGSDSSLISILNASWEHLEPSAGGVVGPILKMTDGWLIFISTGLILRTEDFSSFSEVHSPPTPTPFSDVKLWQGRPTILMQRQIFTLVEDTLELFDPPLPHRNAPCLSLWPSAAGLAAVYEKEVLLLDTDDWQALALRR